MTLRWTRGFSLIEVTVAVAIIAVTMVATSVLLGRIPVDGRGVRDQDLALKIAQDEVELLRTNGYAALPANGPFANVLLSALPRGTDSVIVTVASAKTKQVDVTVAWQASDGATRQITLTTLITQNSGL